MPLSPSAAVFIDNGYLSKILEFEYLKQNLDYLEFSEQVCKDNGYQWIRTLVFDGAPYQKNNPTSQERKWYGNRVKFHADLKALPNFELRLGKQIPYYDEEQGKERYKQKGVDVQLAVDMVAHAWDPKLKVENIILVAGDADFVPAVKYVRSVKMGVTLYHSDKKNPDGTTKCSDALRSECNKCCLLDNDLIAVRCFYVERKK